MKSNGTNRLFLIRAILLSLFFVCFISAYAQDVKELERANKEYMKELKAKGYKTVKELKRANKEYMKELKAKGYKTVKIQTGDNGFWYFLVGKKVNGKYVYGVISKDKKELFECKYASVSYISQIEKDGYKDYTFRDFGGGQSTVSIYNHAMPAHFTLYDSEADNTSVALVDGSIIKVFSDDYYRLGSWIFTNMKEIYTKFDNLQRLWLLNKETKNMGIMTWDGKVLVKNENNLIKITSKTDVQYNGAFVFCDYNGYKVGGFYLENPEVIAPPVYDVVSFDNTHRTINVKLSPTDQMHAYNPNVIENFVPKNKGEEYYNNAKYKECIEYYAKEGVADPDSKFYSADAMYSIARMHINSLVNYVLAPSGNTVYGYNYEEAKSLLQSAIEILKAASRQDVARQDLYNANIQKYNKELNKLEEKHAELLEIFRKKENSFGNMLAKSVMQGLAEGLVNGATNALSEALLGSSSSGGSNNKPVSSNNVAGSSNASKVASKTSNVSSVNTGSSSSEEEAEVKKKEVKYRECGKCRGTGEIFTTSTVATYGQDKKVRCDVCGKEHWLSTVHHHNKCHNCNGTGKVRM